ncbi:GCN5-related N-acetyltransferase [Desulfosarcina variabilis str. Montpellier]|uniref:GNAT family N-acetyltransferase n=1 Tax=Desulfosarcina variabilis TaxID=2300 RepID=UPI003AFA6FFC
MDVEFKYDCQGVDWQMIADMLARVGMTHFDPQLHRKAFENSAVTVFVYHAKQLIGFGRAISDDAYQAAIYDVVVAPEFQRKGLGNTIIDTILTRLPSCNIILYASPGKEGFYEKHGLRKMKTGMARFTNADRMKARGFTE